MTGRELRLRQRIDTLTDERDRLQRENDSLRQQLGKLTGGIRYESGADRVEARRLEWRKDKRRLRRQDTDVDLGEASHGMA